VHSFWYLSSTTQTEKKFSTEITERMKCDKCQRDFKSTQGLGNHKKVCTGALLRFQCHQCSFFMSSNQSLKRHLTSCKSAKVPRPPSNEVDELKSKIKSLEEEKQRLLDIRPQPEASVTASMNITGDHNTVNNSNNVIVLQIDKEVLASMPFSALTDGFRGFADYCLKHVIKGTLKSTDRSRHTVSYMDENNKMIKDIKARQLSEKIFTDVKPRAEELRSDKEIRAEVEANLCSPDSLGYFNAYGVCDSIRYKKPESLTDFGREIAKKV
jgi:hypothetical protein